MTQSNNWNFSIYQIINKTLVYHITSTRDLERSSMYKLKWNRWQYLTFLKLGWTKSHFLCQTWKQGHSEYMCRHLCCLFLSVVSMSCLSRRICSNTSDVSQRTWPVVFSFQEKTFLESRLHVLHVFKFPNQTKLQNNISAVRSHTKTENDNTTEL